MHLRAELLPPKFDPELMNRLAQLANDIDGASNEESKPWIDEFSRLLGLSYDWEEFQGIYGGQSHIDWVYSILCWKNIQPVSDITRDELIEITLRVMEAEDEAYMIILEKNVSCPFTSDLIYWPDEVPDFQFGNDDPTAEEFVDFILQYKQTLLADEDLVKLLDKGMTAELTHEEFYLLSENLEEFEINYLSGWLDKHDLGAEEAIRLIRSGQIIAVTPGNILLKSGR